MEHTLYEMESPRLRFRRLRADDFALVAPILQDAETMYAWEEPFSYDEVVEWIADMLGRYRRDGYGYFAAVSRQSGELIGLAGPLAESVGEETAVGLGCIIRRDLWQQGYGKECVQASLLFVRDVLHVQHAAALIRPENIAGLHLAAACGLQPAGQIDKQHHGKALPHLVCTVALDAQD